MARPKSADSILRNLKKQKFEPKTPIASEMFLPNTSDTKKAKERWNFNGRVGIKTTDPAALLDVGGWVGVPSDIELDPTDTGGANILGDLFIGNTEAGGIGRMRVGSNSNTGFLQWNSYFDGTIQKQMDITKPSFAVRFAGASDRIEFSTSAAGTAIGSFDDRMAVYTDGTIRMGEVDGSNYVTVEPDGSAIFIGTNAGLCFGEISVKDNSTTMTLNSAAKVQVTIFDTDGVSNNITPDHTNDHITVTKAGMYLCTVSMTVENGAGAIHKIEALLYKNNGATAFNNVHAHRDLAAGTDLASVSLSGMIDLAVNDTIELWLNTDRGSNSVVTVEDVTLSLVQIGGT